jgi:putative nucleotidyltransferase with HDIG domain
MNKRTIPVNQVRLGMHIHALEGPWISHPFWKTRFVLNDPEDLQKLLHSGVPSVVIDVSKGLDVQGPAAPSAVPEPAPVVVVTAAPPVAPPKPAGPPPEPSCSMAEELTQAKAIYRQSREQVISMFGEARLGKALDAEQCLPLVNDIADSVFRNPGALVSLARLKTQDDYTYMHSVAVCALMVALGKQLGLDEAACREAGLSGLLHDLGKAVMPLDVLNKPGKLTDDEFVIMKSHPVRGYEMLLEARGAPEGAMDVCLHHHERVDGTGYPHKLPGDKLSLLARMGAVCDVYDAITSNRPYKAGWDPAHSIAQMAGWKGHFDTVVFRALVKLKSGKLAVVTEQNPKNLVSPIVKVFFSSKSQLHITPTLLDLSQSADQIVSRENPEAWGFKDQDALWAGDLPRR